LTSLTTSADDTTYSHEHLVEFYESDGRLVRSVADHLAGALRERDAGIAIATPVHLEQIEALLVRGGIDLDEALSEGRYVPVDATELLQALTKGDTPDLERFRAIVGDLVERAAAGRREVRIYGELVALLLERGDTAATIEIEDLWNELAGHHRFELLCGYPLRAFDADAPSFRHIRGQHTGVVPAARDTLLADVHDQQALVEQLRHDAAALRTELDALRRQQQDLIELAYHDPVTGLANRRAFDSDLEREWALTARGERDSFVLIADLDGFKAVNDTLGHAVGDEVLRAFGRTLRQAARRSDVVARIGGDEFAILLVRCEERAVHTFRARVQDGLALLAEGSPSAIEASFGHASLRRSGSPQTAVDRADLAMLATKRSRRRRRLGDRPER